MSPRHLPVHRQTLAVELVEVFPGGPVRHEIRVRDQYPGRVGVGREYADGFAGLHEESLLLGQRLSVSTILS